MHQTTSGWFNFAKVLPDFSYYITSYSAYVATSTESDGVMIDGLLPPNIL